MDTAPLRRTARQRGTLLVLASSGIAVLVTFASLLGLLAAWPYQQETENWILQARGQDLGNLLAVVVLVGSAVRMRAGSLRARHLWLGTLAYLLYAYLVYGFAVHFSRLFLVYVAILGLVVYTMVAGVSENVRPATYSRGAARTFAAWVLIVIGALFALLWLSELIPATVSGQAPASLETAGLIVNPIHVIDLSVVLPGMIVIGVLARRGAATGLQLTLPALAFSVLMGSSIIAAMVLIVGGGDTSGIVPMVMVSMVVAASFASARAFARGISEAPSSGHSPSPSMRKGGHDGSQTSR